jgi:hypothetical protein
MIRTADVRTSALNRRVSSTASIEPEIGASVTTTLGGYIVAILKAAGGLAALEA